MKGRSFRVVATVLAVGGLCASVIAVDAAGASSQRHVVVGTTRNATWGTILESGGATLYVVKGDKPCNAACQKYWPELVLAKGQTKATAGKGVKRSKLGTKKRSHGVLQVTYGGKPLYKFVADRGRGQVNGNVTDKWGKWSVVVTKSAASHAAAPATSSTAPKGTTTTTGGAHGAGAPISTPAPSPVTTTPPTSPPPTSPPPTSPPQKSPPPTSPPPTTPPTTTPPPTTTTTTPPTTTTTSGGGPAF